ELGADVKWVDSEKKVIVTKDKTTIILVLGQTIATINDDNDKTTASLDVPAKLCNNRTMVPLRFVSESLNALVDYYPEGTLVVINTKHKK
ncbi:MAG: copper amine oxidase N-terminal domain-containing protein, partial [Syntrophomonadaceae bacterium]|nr:copper amine oxidase N-terminal domain-containing protein [Syntrophomonadaceae bacterium]